MEYRESRPPSELAPFVSALWTLVGASDLSGFDLVLPDGCAEIVIHRTGRFREWCDDGRIRHQPNAIVASVMDRAVALSPAPSFETVGVRFWPPGLARLCACPLKDLSHGIAAAEDVLTPAAARLVSTVAQADSLADAVRVLGHGLERLFDRAGDAPETVQRAVRRIRQTGGTQAVDDLVCEMGMTVRTLERQFDRWVGLSPKRYARVVRFHRTVGALVSGPGLSGAALAADCGYFDQAHLTRDFKAFTGSAPHALLTGRLGALTRHFVSGRVSDSSKTPADECGDSGTPGGLP